jgi:ketosteroid isomerase-like protein
MKDTTLTAFLPTFEAGISGFINGDPTLWKRNASHHEDVTIMGAWGAYEKGWSEAAPRYDWAAARMRDSGAKVQVEYLASAVSGDLAYTVAIERSQVLVTGADEPAPMALRVTHIFRREAGEWKMVHRHADPLLGKTAAETVLAR